MRDIKNRILFLKMEEIAREADWARQNFESGESVRSYYNNLEMRATARIETMEMGKRG